jgi:hypothetical protein
MSNLESIRNAGLIIGGIVGGTLAISNLFSQEMNKASKKYSRRITDWDYLKKTLDEEKINQKIPEEVEIKILNFGEFPDYSPSQIHKKSENFYEVYFSPIDLTRDDVRHELFHLKDGHLDKKFHKNKTINAIIANIYYNFYAEPKTAIYCWKNRKTN